MNMLRYRFLMVLKNWDFGAKYKQDLCSQNQYLYNVQNDNIKIFVHKFIIMTLKKLITIVHA